MGATQNTNKILSSQLYNLVQTEQRLRSICASTGVRKFFKNKGHQFLKQYLPKQHDTEDENGWKTNNIFFIIDDARLENGYPPTQTSISPLSEIDTEEETEPEIGLWTICSWNEYFIPNYNADDKDSPIIDEEELLLWNFPLWFNLKIEMMLWFDEEEYREKDHVVH